MPFWQPGDSESLAHSDTSNDDDDDDDDDDDSKSYVCPLLQLETVKSVLW